MPRKSTKHRSPETPTSSSEAKGDSFFFPQQPLLKTIKQFLDEMQIAYDGPRTWTDEDGSERFSIKSSVPMENGNFGVLIFGNERLRTLLFYTVSPLAVPRKRRLAIAELITRLNFGLIHGNLEMDYSDGELRHKMSMEFDGTPPNYSLLRYLLYTGWMQMNNYQPVIESVVIGDATPEEADEQVRSSERSES